MAFAGSWTISIPSLSEATPDTASGKYAVWGGRRYTLTCPFSGWLGPGQSVERGRYVGSRLNSGTTSGLDDRQLWLLGAKGQKLGDDTPYIDFGRSPRHEHRLNTPDLASN